MSNQHLNALMQQAAAAAALVPEHLQQVAFTEGFRFLSSGAPASAPPTGPAVQRRRGSGAPKRTPDEDADLSPADPVQQLIDSFDRSRYPEVASAKSVFDRSLRVLQLAEANGIEQGLTPPQIAQILRQKFKIPTDRTTISGVLSDAPQVDRKRFGSGYAYTLTDAGEKYLEAPPVSASAQPPRATTRKRISNKATSGSSKVKVNRTGADSRQRATEPKRKSTGSGRLGPKAFLEKLIGENFFKSPRVLGDVVQHASAKLGYTYTVNELSPAFTRLLRERALDRQRNESKQYEYFTP